MTNKEFGDKIIDAEKELSRMPKFHLITEANGKKILLNIEEMEEDGYVLEKA